MKSIKEKSEEYGYANWQSDDYHEGASDGLDFDPIGHTQKSFEAGANYVLEEIEAILTTEFIVRRVATDRLRLLEIHSRLKELKGE